jgi:ABC-type branched-chain amino acid transport system, permease component
VTDDPVSVAGAGTGRAGLVRAVHGVERGVVVRSVIIAALLAFVIFAVPSLVGADWLTTFASVSIYSIAAAGFGILYGRVGMISLGQIALLSLGCWIGTRLAYATSMPFRSCCS